MEKTQKQVLKQLHNFLSDSYRTASESYLNGYLTEEDVLLYVENEQSIAKRIADIRQILQDKELAEKFKEIEKGQPIDKAIEEVKEQLQFFELKKKKLQNTDTNTVDEVKNKLKQFNVIDSEIARLEKALQNLEIIKQETAPPKRKPGRPKKNKKLEVQNEI